MYIEFVILDNFLLTYLAGAAAVKLAHNKPNTLRLVVGATVGTVIALFYPYLRGGIVSLSVKAALYVVLCVIMFYKEKRALAMCVLFLCCTFLFGGASYAIGSVFYSEGATAFVRKYPMFLTLTAGAVVYYSIGFCIKRTRAARARAPYMYTASVEVLGMTMSFDAFLDTGNCVYDDMTGLPVLITDMSGFTDKLSVDATVKFARLLPSLRTMAAYTHGGAVEIYLVRPTCITVYSDRHKHKINAMIGLVKSGKNSAPAEMLLNPAVM